MKKLSYILSALLLVASMGMLSSCSDNENFSNLHVLTQDELDEMARQQRIADSLKTVINADLILSYVVEDYPLTGWHNNELKIETDKIAALFGLTEEQVIAGINQEAGAPDIKGFAIQGSTHADVGSASNTNGTWGHWWDKEGNVEKQSGVARFGQQAEIFVVWLGEVDVPHVGAVESFEASFREIDLPIADAAACHRVFVGNAIGLVP